MLVSTTVAPKTALLYHAWSVESPIQPMLLRGCHSGMHIIDHQLDRLLD